MLASNLDEDMYYKIVGRGLLFVQKQLTCAAEAATANESHSVCAVKVTARRTSLFPRADEAVTATAMECTSQRVRRAAGVVSEVRTKATELAVAAVASASRTTAIERGGEEAVSASRRTGTDLAGEEVANVNRIMATWPGALPEVANVMD